MLVVLPAILEISSSTDSDMDLLLLNLLGQDEFCCRVNIMAGHDALEKIPGLLSAMRANNPMILTDKGVKATGLVSILVQAMEKGLTIECIEDDVPPDSDVNVVHRLAGIYNETGSLFTGNRRCFCRRRKTGSGTHGKWCGKNRHTYWWPGTVHARFKK